MDEIEEKIGRLEAALDRLGKAIDARVKDEGRRGSRGAASPSGAPSGSGEDEARRRRAEAHLDDAAAALRELLGTADAS